MLKKRSTKDLITESTKELLRSGLIEKLTVKKIAGNCGITPQTFYNHFKDKYEVVARIYTDTMSPYLMSSLEEWFEQKAEMALGDQSFYGHAFAYSGQNCLRDTLVRFDLQKYLLHVPREIPADSVDMKVLRQGVVAMIYSQFGLYDATIEGSMELTPAEYGERFGTIKEIMMAWAPSIVGETLLDYPTCRHALWDPETETVVATY